MASKLRLVSLFAVLAIAVGLFALNIGNGTDRASADNVANEYSLEAETGGVPVTGPFQTIVAVGSSVNVQLRVDFSGGGVCDGSTGIFGCYQAAQWRLNYDDGVLTTTTAAITKVGAAPGACTSESVTLAGPASFALTGCLDLAGANLSYSGAVWNVPMTCDVAGVSPISLEPDTTSPGTFIDDGAALQSRHYHINDDDAGAQEPNSGAIACVDVADIVAQKALTSPAPTLAGSPVVYTVTATNTGPAPWLGPIVADDLPDNVDVSGCSPAPPALCALVSIDADGDSTAEYGPSVLTCVFIPALSPNPFGLPSPDPIISAIACPGSLAVPPVPAIAVGGKMIATITVLSDPDDCNDTYDDVGIGTADSPTAPFFGVPGSNLDPDFLDGIDGTEDNFAPLSHTVGDCPVTIVKSGPLSGTVGDSDSYTLTVTNAGPSQATGVVVTDTVPAGLVVTSAVGTGCGNVGNVVTCNIGTIPAGGVEIITINFDEPNAGTFCNTADGTWVRGNGTETDSDDSANTSSNEVCFTVLPPYNGLVKAVDLNGDTDTSDPGESPEAGEDTIEVNLWLCIDQSSDGIDNDGNSTVDDEPNTCDGDLVIEEQIYVREDCDTRNDDDDGDGEPVSNDPASPGYRPECPDPTLQDYIDDNDGDGNGNVDKDGGELPEGLGAFEFQLKFDHKIFDITVNPSDDATDGIDNDHDGTIDEPDEDWANGRAVNCTMTIISENDIRFGCVTTGAGLGHPQVSGVEGASITVSPEADLVFRIRPGKDNGVVRRLLDENCEVADIYGDIFPLTNAGLTPDCTDIDITVRRLEGDLDTDCDVTVTDAQRIAFRYGSFFGQLLYDTFYDLEPFVTPDFDIDIKDLQFVFGRIGSTCDDPIPDNQDPLSANGVGQP